MWWRAPPTTASRLPSGEEERYLDSKAEPFETLARLPEFNKGEYDSTFLDKALPMVSDTYRRYMEIDRTESYEPLRPHVSAEGSLTMESAATLEPGASDLPASEMTGTTTPVSAGPPHTADSNAGIAPQVSGSPDMEMSDHDPVSAEAAPTKASDATAGSQAPELNETESDAVVSPVSVTSTATTASTVTAESQAPGLNETENDATVSPVSVSVSSAATTASTSTVKRSAPRERPAEKVKRGKPDYCPEWIDCGKCNHGPSCTKATNPKKPVCRRWLRQGGQDCGRADCECAHNVRRESAPNKETAPVDEVENRRRSLLLIELVEGTPGRPGLEYKKIKEDYPTEFWQPEATLRGRVFDMYGGSKAKKDDSAGDTTSPVPGPSNSGAQQSFVSAALRPAAASSANMMQAPYETQGGKGKRGKAAALNVPSSAILCDVADAPSAPVSKKRQCKGTTTLGQRANATASYSAARLSPKELFFRRRICRLPDTQHVINMLELEPRYFAALAVWSTTSKYFPPAVKAVEELLRIEEAMEYPAVADHMVDMLREKKKREVRDAHPTTVNLREAGFDKARLQKIKPAEIKAWIAENSRGGRRARPLIHGVVEAKKTSKARLIQTAVTMLDDWEGVHVEETAFDPKESRDLNILLACKKPALFARMKTEEIRLSLELLTDPITARFRNASRLSKDRYPAEWKSMRTQQIRSWLSETVGLDEASEAYTRQEAIWIVETIFATDSHLGQKIDTKATLIKKIQDVMGLNPQRVAEAATLRAEEEEAIAELADEELKAGLAWRLHGVVCKMEALQVKIASMPRSSLRDGSVREPFERLFEAFRQRGKLSQLENKRLGLLKAIHAPDGTTKECRDGIRCKQQCSQSIRCSLDRYCQAAMSRQAGGLLCLRHQHWAHRDEDDDEEEVSASSTGSETLPQKLHIKAQVAYHRMARSWEGP